MDKNFWRHKKLANFTEKEWEDVCMRCGKCCLFKHQKNNRIYFSNIMCENFNFKTGRCSCYKTRLSDTCLKVDMNILTEQPECLPETCAYRLLLAGKELPAYHPLISGNPDSVHEAKQTVLEIPEVYSIAEYDEFIEKLMACLMNDTATEEEVEMLQQYKTRYKQTFIASYPIPNKQRLSP